MLVDRPLWHDPYLQGEQTLLTIEVLNFIDPQERIYIIGDQLFEMIQAHAPALASQITNMLIDSGDLSYLLRLIYQTTEEHEPTLLDKVNEALILLSPDVGFQIRV